MEKKDIHYHFGSLAAYGISAGSVLLFPIDFLRNIPGVMFWLGLFTGCVLQWLLNRERKRFDSRQTASNEEREIRPGILRFFSNKKARVADVIFPIAVIGFIITAHRTHFVGYFGYVFLATALFAFYMHCIFNGRNYEYIQKKKKDRQNGKTGREEEKGNEV